MVAGAASFFWCKVMERHEVVGRDVVGRDIRVSRRWHHGIIRVALHCYILVALVMENEFYYCSLSTPALEHLLIHTVLFFFGINYINIYDKLN